MNGPTTPQPRRDQRVGIVEGWELRRSRSRDANAGAWKGLAFVAITLIVLVVGGWFAARPVLGPAITELFQQNPGIIRIPVVADLLNAELSDRVDRPAGSDETAIRFQVEEGQSIDEIQAGLIEAGLLNDPVAFEYLVLSDKVDQLIKAGPYTMTALMSPSDIVERLAADPDPPIERVVVDLRPGLRIEQIVAKLQLMTEETNLELDPSAFRDLALEPPEALRDRYRFLRQAPAGNSLEGFLAGGVYEVPINITADEFLDVLLQQWEEDSGSLVAQARRRGVDFYDALKIASLVEREVKVDKERTRVAGVYWNRLDPRVNGETAGLMGADPTVVYAADTMELEDRGLSRWPQYVFWDTLGVDLNTVDVPPRLDSFQTYRNPGLPDWPIATPTRASLEAALDPDRRQDRLYFYACPGSDTHRFAKNLRQHERNIRRCQ